MLKTILSISGKPGLYKLISQGKNMLIVESISAEKKRFPAYGNEKIISLADIAMYTNDAEVPLRDVLESIKEKENAAVASIDPKKATAEELRSYLAEVFLLPTELQNLKKQKQKKRRKNKPDCKVLKYRSVINVIEDVYHAFCFFIGKFKTKENTLCSLCTMYLQEYFGLSFVRFNAFLLIFVAILRHLKCQAIG